MVLGDLPEWRAGLRQADVDLVDGEPQADLAIAPSALASRAIELAPAAVIVEGRDGGLLARAGYTVQRYVPRPGLDEPSLLVPLDQPSPAAYAVRRWSVIDSPWKQLRASIAAVVLERGLPLPLQPMITIGVREPGLPYLVQAARDLGVPDTVRWVLTLGQGDALSRNVFHLFPAGEDSPRWVLKFARVAGHSDPFDRDAHGYAIVESVSGLAHHAPRLVGRFAVDGVHASLETAAVGRRLRDELRAPPRMRRSRSLVDDVAAWILELGRATADRAGLQEERRRLLDRVVPAWGPSGAQASLVTDLPPLPSVAQHNDLGTWNVIVDGSDFTVVDWESANAGGLPLWDLLYFLTDALAVLDGSTGERQPEHTRRLFRGELRTSPILFGWIRRAVREFSIPPAAVGSIATLCWLHHSLSSVARAEARSRFGDHSPAVVHGMEPIAGVWLSDPGLGPGWNRWER